MNRQVIIIGAGLAGCEAALQLSSRGYKVFLYDEKPAKMLPPYSLPTFSELVCNNSLSPISFTSSLWVLTEELKIIGSYLIKIADECRVDDKNNFAIDKKEFSAKVTQALIKNDNIEIINKSISELPNNGTIILATGPLTNDKLMKSVTDRFGVLEYHFSDASSIVVDITSIDTNNPYVNRISDDVFSVSIDSDIFHEFCNRLTSGVKFVNETDSAVDFEKCQSIEKLALSSESSLAEKRFTHPSHEGVRLLLRRENGLDNGFIMVGCMTTLKHYDQKKAISVLPGFNNVRIIKYGRMHRNSYFDSPKFLNSFYKASNKDIYIIGQISGIDGYLPAVSSGLVSALRIICGESLRPFPKDTMIGALANYISNQSVVDFQPMCASFSLMEKTEAQSSYSDISKQAILQYKSYLENEML